MKRRNKADNNQNAPNVNRTLDERDFSRSSIGKERLDRSLDSHRIKSEPKDASAILSNTTSPMFFGLQSARSKSPDLTPNVVPLSTDALNLLHKRVARIMEKSHNMVMLEDQIRNNRENIDKALTIIKTKGGSADIDEIVHLMNQDFLAENRQKEVYLRVLAELEKLEELKKLAVNEIVEDLHRAQLIQNEQEEFEQRKIQDKKTQMALAICSKKDNSDEQRKFKEIMDTLVSVSTDSPWFQKLSYSRGMPQHVPEDSVISKVKCILGQAEEAISKLLTYKQVTDPKPQFQETEGTLNTRILSPTSKKIHPGPTDKIQFQQGAVPVTAEIHHNPQTQANSSGLPSFLPAVSDLVPVSSHRTRDHKKHKNSSIATSVDTEPYTKSRVLPDPILPRVRPKHRRGSKDESEAQHAWSLHSRDGAQPKKQNQNASFDIRSQHSENHSKGKHHSIRSAAPEERLQFNSAEMNEGGLLDLREYRKIFNATYDASATRQAGVDVDKLLKRNAPSSMMSPRKMVSTRVIFPKLEPHEQPHRRSKAERADVKSVDRGLFLA